MVSPEELWRRLLLSFQRKSLERELQGKMQQHMQLKAQEHIEAVASSEDAGYGAQRQMGNMVLQPEQSRASWRFPLLESIVQDVRYGLRGLRKAPGFTAAAVLTLALGIGATSAIFSVFYMVLLKPLPYYDPSRLVMISTETPAFPGFRLGVSSLDYAELNAASHAFEGLALYRTSRSNLSGEQEPEQLTSVSLSSGFLSLLGMHPELGRGFAESDGQQGSANVVLLSHDLWQRRFAADPAVVGRTITLDQKPRTVIGVLPAKADFLQSEVFLPLTFSAQEQRERRFRFCFVIGRLKSGMKSSNAQAELDTIAARLGKTYPDDKDLRFDMRSLQEWFTGNSKPALRILLGAVAFLLLIACANASNLILSRGIQRRREIALREALGAGRGRIIRQLLIESLLLSLLGGAVGIVLAVCGTRLLTIMNPDMPGGNGPLSGIAWSAIAIATLTGLVSGLLPAWHNSRLNLQSSLKERMPSSASFESRPWKISLRNVLVTGEIVLALILLTGSALMVQSLVRLLHVDTGFRTDHLLTADLNLPASRKSQSDAAQELFAQQLLEALRGRKEFTHVALSDSTTLTGNMRVASVEAGMLNGHNKAETVGLRSVSPDFFETFGIPVLAGRTFNDHDIAGATRVAIVNKAMADYYWPGENVLGRDMRLGDEETDHYQIVGVVGNVRDVNLSVEPRTQIYLAFSQSPSPEIHLVARSSTEPLDFVPALRQAVWSVDKNQPVTHIQTLEQVIAKSTADRRLRTLLIGAFATLGLILTLIGIYGVISYSVSQRIQEIGIRLALGAQPKTVLLQVLGQGFKLALIGAVLGLMGSLLLMRLLANQLFGVKPSDPATLLAVMLLMLAVAVAASYVPARRATKVDPMVALRCE
ncbi:MAG: hypothetical protein DMG65_22340 [Candidatus Angelobacter sp. Gp1-AA117]|nr:MAG: hypothetical protein DMG65_22340 [Candidatus Angelobacter sp. Gp1-AA117]